MNEIVIALVAAVPAFLIGFLAYRRSIKVDKVSAQSGVASDQRAGTQQLIEGLNTLLDQAQETIKEDREVKKLLEARIEKFIVDLDACKAENARLRRKFGDNGQNGTAAPG